MIEIVINAGDAPTLRLWHAVAELTERLPAGWVLIGGLMVQLCHRREANGHLT